MKAAGATERALLTDYYQLTMLQAYWAGDMEDEAVFDLYYRTLPEGRNYILAAGLEPALEYLEELHFTPEALDELSRYDDFRPGFLEWLGDFRFTGDVRAVPEGTPVFPDEPIVEVRAPIAEAQIAETFIMNQIHFQSVLASKAARVVQAARGRNVVDFGIRRMHGTDAAVGSARAFHIAGVAATSNVLAGHLYRVPVTGTMAHSFIQAHDDERQAFRDFVDLYPETVLLVDTYDTLEGVRRVVELADEIGPGFRVRGIRLDSGDLGELAKASRAILDEAGLHDVDIFASGGLDEWKIRALLDDDAPIDGFGVGTRMGVARDAPALDMAYKLTGYAGKGRLKLSEGKKILPGPKQIFRIEEDGRAAHDVLALADEEHDGRPLLATVMVDGERVRPHGAGLDEARERAREELDRLPDRFRALEDADPPYEVRVSDRLRAYQEEVAGEVAERAAGS